MATSNAIVSIATTNGITQVESFESDAGFVTSKGSAASEGDIYYNTTAESIRAFVNGAWEVLSGSARLVSGTTEETSPASGDFVGLVDISDSNAENKITLANLLKVVNDLTEDTTPLKADSILTYDASASAAKKVTLSNMAANIFPVPTVQKFTSGSGTYTTPANCRWIKVQMVGGGGGGGGGGTTSGTASTNGGNSTFGTTLLVANGGTGGSRGGNGGAGGSASLGTGPVGIAMSGGQGGGAAISGGTVSAASPSIPGGFGGSTPFGCTGTAAGGTGGVGVTAAANSGAGGSGAGCGAVNSHQGGSGGGGGGYVDALITSPAASYDYAVGAGGSGQLAGTSGEAGGNGAAGLIVVWEYY